MRINGNDEEKGKDEERYVEEYKKGRKKVQYLLSTYIYVPNRKR